MLFVLASCSPDFEVYAPEKELFVVYGVLNPHSPVQYVTVTKVFQYDGDAYAYAGANDLTARGLTVRLLADSTIWTSTLVEVTDSSPSLFSQTTGAYRFETTGGMALQPGKRYQLEITKPDDPQLHITAFTNIPTAPALREPGPPIFSAMHGTFTFPTIDFSQDVDVYFERGSGNGFELRLYTEYWDQGHRHVARWGPTHVFKEPVRCNVGATGGCYQITANAVSRELHSAFALYPDTVEVYDTLRVAHSLDSLNRSVWMEVTAIDTFLTSYLTANTAFGFGLNLLMDRQEFSNISGDNAGVFGSINTASNFLFLSSCTRWMAGLRGVRPSGCGG